MLLLVMVARSYLLLAAQHGDEHQDGLDKSPA